MEQVSTSRGHGGTQGVYSHRSAATGTPMTFSVFVPDHAPGASLPVLWYLSGLTCTHANVTEKGEYRPACTKHRIIFVAPDTSPRGPDNDGRGVPDAAAYDFGQGAGFYVDATQAPWASHFRMRSYIEQELPALVTEKFPVDMDRQGITGHSMGGHGALTTALRNPGRFRSVSAFSPIVNPLNCPWGEKALAGYLGHDRLAWRECDACALIGMARGCLNCWSTKAEQKISLPNSSRPTCWSILVPRRTFLRRSGCSRATTIPTTSSPASWPSMSAGLP